MQTEGTFAIDAPPTDWLRMGGVRQAMAGEYAAQEDPFHA